MKWYNGWMFGASIARHYAAVTQTILCTFIVLVGNPLIVTVASLW